MNRTPVNSTNIASIGYEENQMILEVEFLNGNIYRYEGVPEHIYDDFLNASSKGQYFYYNIRNSGYPYYRIS